MSAIQGLRVAVLTVSDRVAGGSRGDEGGDALGELVEAAGGAVVARRVVPDEREEISGALRAMAGGADVVLTTGGTGLGPRDVTPEATSAVLDREAPGIAEALRQSSLAITPFAMLSRGTAGLLGRVLVVNLPGNPKAVREEWQVLAPVLAHAVQTASGPVPDASHHAADRHGGHGGGPAGGHGGGPAGGEAGGHANRPGGA
jgi:molybdenum cofactor synthesis domain-containing protein